MDRDVEFSHLTRCLEQSRGDYEKANAERRSSETLIESAEYELDQVKKAFADNRLDAEPGAPARRRRAASAGFASKLRKPEMLDKPKWRTALGLNE